MDELKKPDLAVNKATVRVLSVLSAIADHMGPVGVTKLSRQLRMTKNMVHRALPMIGDAPRQKVGPEGSRRLTAEYLPPNRT